MLGLGDLPMPLLNGPLRAHTRMRLEIEPILGSRFIATLVPAEDDAALQRALEEVRAEMPDATHHCWAWRALGTGVERCSDDGEPGGTAGRPILARLAGAKVVCALLVVTRYYGGTKLGTGGLVRAYGAAASAVLDAADLEVHVDTQRFALTLDYAHQHAVEQALAHCDAQILDRTFGARVTLQVALPEARIEEARRALADATNGATTLER